ncbi:MAG: AMIN domain-containing protein [Selenomonadales bacterium]|nr:AMIN domain-containing protein [Selenomonadales bacterium]
MKQHKSRYWRIGTAAVLASFLMTSAVLAAPAVQNVRTSQTKDTVRVVADLTEKAAYEAYWQERENDYIVRLDGVKSNASLAAVKHALFAAAEVVHGNDGALYFVFDLKEKATAKTFMLESPTRLVVDFTREGGQPAVFAVPERTSTVTDTSQSPLSDIQDVRIYHGADKVRTVFDMSSAAEYETSYQSESGVLTIRMKNVSAAERRIPAPKVGDVMKSVNIMTDGSDTVVHVQLKPYSVYNVFSLKEPHRIVVDTLKEYQTEKKSPTA